MAVTEQEIRESRAQHVRKLQAAVKSLVVGVGALSEDEVLRLCADALAEVRAERRERDERYARLEQQAAAPAGPGTAALLAMAGATTAPRTSAHRPTGPRHASPARP